MDCKSCGTFFDPTRLPPIAGWVDIEREDDYWVQKFKVECPHCGAAFTVVKESFFKVTPKED